MLHKKSIIVLTLLFIVAIGIWTAAANALADQKAVLSGKVAAVVAPGATVREGDTLVRVETITGSVPAARATTDGVVKEVLVKPGVTITTGDIVARIQPVRK